MVDFNKYIKFYNQCLNTETGNSLLRRNKRFREIFIQLQNMLKEAISPEEIPEKANGLVDELFQIFDKNKQEQTPSAQIKETLKTCYPYLNSLFEDIELRMPQAVVNISNCLLADMLKNSENKQSTSKTSAMP